MCGSLLAGSNDQSMLRVQVQVGRRGCRVPSCKGVLQPFIRHLEQRNLRDARRVLLLRGRQTAQTLPRDGLDRCHEEGAILSMAFPLSAPKCLRSEQGSDDRYFGTTSSIKVAQAGFDVALPEMLKLHPKEPPLKGCLRHGPRQRQHPQVHPVSDTGHQTWYAGRRRRELQVCRMSFLFSSLLAQVN